MAKILGEGTYRLNYRIGGIFEIISVSQGDLKEAFNKTLVEFSGAKPVNGGVKYNRSDMIASVYLEVTADTFDLDKWNTTFMANFKSIFPWWQWFIQQLEIKFIDSQLIKKTKAKEEISQPGLVSEATSTVGKYLLYAVIGGVAAYALVTGLTRK